MTMKLFTPRAPSTLSDDKGNELLVLSSANESLGELWLRAEYICAFYEKTHHANGGTYTSIEMVTGEFYDVKETPEQVASMIFQEDITEQKAEEPTNDRN